MNARFETFALLGIACLAAFALEATAQTTCPSFTYVHTKTQYGPGSTTAHGWPDSTNNFGYHQYSTLPLSAFASRPCIQVPPGFSTHLWASELAFTGGIKSMVAMNWDEKGRLWGVETRDYPNRVLSNPLPGGGGADRIVVVADTNGDGVADTRKIFAEGFNLLTGLVWTVDGLVVAMAPHILLFKDENGDDVADNPSGTILYTGFGRSDTHASLSNLMYGLDGWIYATVGYSAGTNIRNPNTNQNFSGNWSQRIIRFKSDGSSIQSLTAMSNNTWGLGISETGQIFASTANRDHSLHEVFPGQRHQTPIYTGANQGYVQQPARPGRPVTGVWADPHPVTTHVNINNGGYPATSNHSLYTARHFPQKYWDRTAFICDAPHHLCHIVNLDTLGSTWKASENTSEYNLYASTDPWSAPIQAHTGPDGAVWVLDWYNYLNNHNGICGPLGCGTGAAQISPIRDTTMTRIHRVVYDARPLDPILNLSQATEDQLLATFNHTNFLWRLQAQRLLIKRGSNPGLITKLQAILNSRAVNDMGESPQVIHAIRTLENFGAFAAAPGTWVPILSDLLRHPSPGVRWNAIDAMPNDASATAAILTQGRINDPNAHVRIRALHKLVGLPGTKSGQMYTPYVTRDTYSQNRFNAVGGLTQTGTLPSIPSLYPPVSVNASPKLQWIGAQAFYRNGSLEIRGLDASAEGALTVWDSRGARVAGLPIAGGRLHGGSPALRGGAYAYRVDVRGHAAVTGRFTVLGN